MKKILCFLLVLICFTGCTAQKQVSADSVTVYYMRENPVYGSPDGVIAPSYLDAMGRKRDIPFLLNLYLQKTPEEGLVSTFPAGVTLISYKLEGLTATIVLSDQIADLSGMDLTIALSCFTKTVMSLTNCEEVILSAWTKDLDGQSFITLNKDSYLLLDDSGQSKN